MRISDWSSDVCSSDLDRIALGHPRQRPDERIWVLARHAEQVTLVRIDGEDAESSAHRHRRVHTPDGLDVARPARRGVFAAEAEIRHEPSPGRESPEREDGGERRETVLVAHSGSWKDS